MTEREKAIAVVPAAGTGARMGRDTPKQYLELAGSSTVIEHTLYTLLACPFIERIIVGIASGDDIWPTLGVASHQRLFTAPGGQDRADTVTNCLAQLNDENERRWILVHDAARPCVRREDIALMWQSLQNEDCGGLLAVPLSDTIKRANDEEFVAETLDRNSLWAAQTPQMFRLGPLLSALESAHEQGIEVTDEASAIEHAGGKPKLMLGSVSNIKITRPDDLALAAFYLSEQSEG